MKILAIETSCDETAAAIVEDGRTVLASIIATQAEMHALTGGVVPEVAAREHTLKVAAVISKAMSTAGLKAENLDALAVTAGPGLLSSLVVGVTAAQTLAFAWQKPLIPVNHISGHIYSNSLDLSPTEEVQFPILVLTVSGGHNEIVLLRGHFDFEVIGETFDDSAGEAFDKVARLLGLGYPGGPAIARAALEGNADRFDFPRAMMKSNDWNFSFSGLKTAVLREVEVEYQRSGKLTTTFINDISASFEECVSDILAHKIWQAALRYQVKEVHLAGGVSANQRLRGKLQKMSAGQAVKLRYNQNLKYCTDNAAMIASAAYYLWNSGKIKPAIFPDINPSPQYPLV